MPDFNLATKLVDSLVDYRGVLVLAVCLFAYRVIRSRLNSYEAPSESPYRPRYSKDLTTDLLVLFWALTTTATTHLSFAAGHTFWMPNLLIWVTLGLLPALIVLGLILGLDFLGRLLFTARERPPSPVPLLSLHISSLAAVVTVIIDRALISSLWLHRLARFPEEIFN